MPVAGDVVNNRYEVNEMIGSGGSSHVYLVTDRHIGRRVAMKVMDKRSFGAVGFARSEIESLRCLRHPLFPAILDAFYDRDNIYIISEYVRGQSLSDIIKSGEMTRERALIMAGHICGALSYLHTMKVPLLYLDLKPDNIIVDPEGLPHLIDFGIAGRLLSRRLPIGTLGYSPPEQYDPDGDTDVRSDIFALGMTYFAMRHKKPPDPDLSEALDDIKRSRILSSVEKTFLLRCCAPLREDRYESASEVSKHIKQIRSIPYRRRKRILILALTTGAVITLTYFAKKAVNVIRQNEAASRLAEKATRHMSGGNYTPEGIGIIKACINSGTLPDGCEQEFIFEVAMNAMLIEHDYRTAAAYFARLDEKKYPEVKEYRKLCDLQNGFDHDPKEAMEVTGRLFADIVKRPPSVMKYENMIFIANCFENYDPDREEGTVKALSVLSFAEEELDRLIDDEGYEDGDYIRMRNRLYELMRIKKQRKETRKKIKAVMAGGNDE